MKTIKDIINDQTEQIKTDAKHQSYLYLLDYIVSNVSILSINIDTNIRLEYTGDFYGLLKHQRCNPKLDYINTLLNGLNSSNEYLGTESTIYVIDETSQKINYIMSKLKNI